tara:strand:+ start:614 stop:898 length:285 start_codon:yes stop_codon:yes gene_type:complete
MMKRKFKQQIMTIQEIKKRTEKTSPYYFSKNSLEDFGQKLEDFEITKLTETKYLISADSFWEGRLMGKSRRIFDTITNNLDSTSFYSDTDINNL